MRKFILILNSFFGKIKDFIIIKSKTKGRERRLFIIGIILISLFALGIVKDQIIKLAITAAVTKVTGAPVRIDGFSLSVFKQSVRIKGFKIYQPKGYGKEILLDIEKVNVNYDLGALFKKKLHLPLVELDLKKAVIIRNKEGVLSVDALKISKKEKKGHSQDKKQKASSEKISMQIDVLKLNLGRVISKEFTSSGEPSINTFDINVKNKTYKNITSAQQLIGLLLIESMKPAAIKSAKIYGVVSLAGVAFLPVGIAVALTGKSSVSDTFDVSFNNAYKVSLDILNQAGVVKKEDKAAGIIAAKVKGADVNLKIEKQGRGKVKITISAKKYLLPKAQIAGTVLYKLAERLQK